MNGTTLMLKATIPTQLVSGFLAAAAANKYGWTISYAKQACSELVTGIASTYFLYQIKDEIKEKESQIDKLLEKNTWLRELRVIKPISIDSYCDGASCAVSHLKENQSDKGFLDALLKYKSLSKENVRILNRYDKHRRVILMLTIFARYVLSRYQKTSFSLSNVIVVSVSSAIINSFLLIITVKLLIDNQSTEKQ